METREVVRTVRCVYPNSPKIVTIRKPASHKCPIHPTTDFHYINLKVYVECHKSPVQLSSSRLEVYNTSTHIIDIPIEVEEGGRNFSGTLGILENAANQPTLKLVIYPDLKTDLVPCQWKFKVKDDIELKIDWSATFESDITITTIVFEVITDVCSGVNVLIE